MQSVRNYVNLEIKLVKQSQQLTFNLRCKHFRLVPPSLRVKALVKTPEGYRIADQASFRFLCARVGENVRNIKTLKNDISFKEQQLKRVLGQELFNELHVYVVIKRSRVIAECKTRMCAKFERLQCRRVRGLSDRKSTAVDRWVVNLSSQTLSSPQTSILSRGLNFALAPRKVPIPHIVAAVEKGLKSIPSESAQGVRHTVVGILKNAKPLPNNISLAESQALRVLRHNTDIAILTC